MPKRAEIDTSLLRRSELVEYKRLTMIATSNAPYNRQARIAPGAVRRLRNARLVYVIVWIIGIGVVTTVCGAIYGSAAIIGAAMGTAFALGLLLHIAFWFHSEFVADRAKKDALRAVDEYLESIGYTSRRERTRDSDSDDFQIKSRRRMQHEWYEDHSELNWRDREQAGIFGMDADTYVNNFLEHDKD